MADKEERLEKKKARLNKRKSKLAKKMTAEHMADMDEGRKFKKNKFKRQGKRYTRLKDKLEKVSNKSKKKDAYSVSGPVMGSPMRGAGESVQELSQSGYKMGSPMTPAEKRERLHNKMDRPKTPDNKMDRPKTPAEKRENRKKVIRERSR